VIDAIANGPRSPGLQQRLDALEARNAELARSLVGAPRSAPRLHPNLAEVYRQRVAGLQVALQGADSAGALEDVRGLIERVVLHPGEDGQRGFEIELVGEIAAMVGLGKADARRTAGDQDMFLRSMKVVAGARNHLDLLLTG
jgi:site-specific DNA recombinase